MKNGQAILRILLCDDDPQDRKLMKAYLQQRADREIVLLEAGQTDEIQVALDKGRIDLVLMDIQMPEKSGMEWLKQIVENQIAPVVMLTGCGNEEIAVESLQQGAVGYLPKSRITAEKLLDAIEQALEKWRQLILSKANQEQLERLANVDSLTGLLNRRAILKKLDEQMKNTRRYRDELSVLMLDIDHFKGVNDNYGHVTGDNVLEKIAALLQNRIRDTDAVGRYGGEEFLIILRRAEFSSVLPVAERIQKAIRTARMRNTKGDVFSITVSQGLARYKPGDDRHSLILRADAALYMAKQNGRDRIETFEVITAGI